MAACINDLIHKNKDQSSDAQKPQKCQVDMLAYLESQHYGHGMDQTV